MLPTIQAPAVETPPSIMATPEQRETIQAIGKLNDDIAKLSTERKELEATLPDLLVYQNIDKTWTRWSRTNNVDELTKKEKVFVGVYVDRLSTKIEVLKNEPKELKAKEPSA